MSAKPKNIFTRSKPLMKIYSGVDDEGKEVRKIDDCKTLVCISWKLMANVMNV